MFPLDPNAPRAPETPTRSKRDLYDWLIFTVQALGVIGVAITIIITLLNNAGTSRDTAHAIAQMSAIANSMAAERPAIERQATAAADSAKASKDTAAAARGQTGAINKQANALIKSAQSTITAASAQLAAAQANTKTAEAGARAAELQQQSATLFAATRAPIAKLRQVDIIGWTDQPKKGLIELSVTPHIQNAGGGTLLAGVTSFNMMITNSVPATRPNNEQFYFGGNESPISSGTDYGPTQPIKAAFAADAVETVKQGKKGLIVWGTIRFSDVSGKMHQSCFLDLVVTPTIERAGGEVRAIALPAYQCAD